MVECQAHLGKLVLHKGLQRLFPLAYLLPQGWDAARPAAVEALPPRAARGRMDLTCPVPGIKHAKPLRPNNNRVQRPTAYGQIWRRQHIRPGSASRR